MNDKIQSEYEDAMHTAGIIPWLFVGCVVELVLCVLVMAVITYVTGYSLPEFIGVLFGV